MSGHSDTASSKISRALTPYKDAVEQGDELCIEVVHDNPRPGFDSWVRGQQGWVLLTCGKVLYNIRVVCEIGTQQHMVGLTLSGGEL